MSHDIAACCQVRSASLRTEVVLFLHLMISFFFHDLMTFSTEIKEQLLNKE